MIADILIPTLGRHRAIQPLAANILNTTPQGSFHAIFVADEGDTETRRVLDELCLPDGPWSQLIEDGSYPSKVNAAYRFGRGDLVLPTADDVRMGDGWLDAALNALGDPSIQVVGTDDLSQVTEQRKLATMPILRRSYCDTPGAAWAETGSVFHTGFHHSFVDRELWELAIHRGVAAWADDCVIEHLHPSFGKREVDETDRKGNLSNFEADEALYMNRRAQWMRS